MKIFQCILFVVKLDLDSKEELFHKLRFREKGITFGEEIIKGLIKKKKSE